MKKIILLISLSLVFTQELKVEGNLRVNGVVLNTKVDSMEQIIDSLQTQLTVQQTLIEQLQAQIILLGQQLGLVDCAGEFGGSAVLDACGVCDNDLSNDGNFDNCGVCDNDASNDCYQDCAGTWGGDAVVDACWVCGGDAVSQNQCVTYITDNQDNVYEAIWIGDQLWMAENLKTTKYQNDEEILTGLSIGPNGDWINSTEGAYAFYDDNLSHEETYGNLYNWYAVDDSRGICPEGWHIPSVDEWTILSNHLGGESVAGGKMKKAGLEHWNSPNTGASNESGFTGLPGGYRSGSSGGFAWINTNGTFWSSVNSNDHWAIAIDLFHDSEAIDLQHNDTKNSGFSVRCIQD